MRRRSFVFGMASAAALGADAVGALAQQRERPRRVAALLNLTSSDPEAQARLAAFLQGMQEEGWRVGGNLRVDIRWGDGDAETIRKGAAQVVALEPDVILASTNQVMTPLLRITRTIPIVFAAVTDPVAAGHVASLARPGRNATGFTSAEYGLSVKWLELLKEIAPQVRRVAVVYSSSNPGGVPQFAAIQSMAPSLGVETVPIDLVNAESLERDVAAFARGDNPKAGLIVTRTSEVIVHRETIIRLVAEHKLPAVYPLRLFVNDGGLISYGPDIVDQHRRAASYVSRILKGEKVSELPVQTPIKYETIVNAKTAKTIGISLSASVLARADEVIE